MADVITRLKVESSEYDSKIKRAAQGIQHMADACHRAGGVLNVLEDENREYIRSLGQMETVSKSARGRLNELTAGFMDLKKVYNDLSQEEKRGEVGRELNRQLDIMKGRVKDAREELNAMTRELNEGGSSTNILDVLGQKLGVTGNLTEMLTSKTALMTAGIGASVAIIGKATQAWVAYNSELAKQDQITTVTTGLTGGDANNMTDSMRAMTDTYGVDFRDSINAANTLMTQFGVSGDRAIALIRDGMQGMIQGDGPKLLQMIQKYAPSFRDAGISAEQLVAIIHNSEGGIFTDANMDAITMGIKNIRLMTKATSDALAKLGIDGEEMSRKLSDGTLSIFDAMKQVMTAVQGVESGSQAAGEVLNSVFGRQGAAAGSNIAKAIENLNLNLEETKRQTGEVGEAYAELQTANEQLNTSIREAFSYNGWEQMAQGIKSRLVTALAAVIDKLADIRRFFGGSFDIGGMTSSKEVQNQLRKLELAKKTGSTYSLSNMYQTQMSDYRGKISGLQGYMDRYDQNHSSVNTVLLEASKKYGQKFRSMEDVRNLKTAYERSYSDYQKGASLIFNSPSTSDLNKNTPIIKPTGGGGGKTTPAGEKDDFQEIEEVTGLLAKQKQIVADLEAMKPYAQTEEELTDINKKLEKANAEMKRLQDLGKETKPQEIAGLSEQSLSLLKSRQQQEISTLTIGSDDYNKKRSNINETNIFSSLLNESMMNGIQVDSSVAESIMDSLLNGDSAREKIEELVEYINEHLAEGIDPIELDFEGGKTRKKKKEDKKNEKKDEKKDASLTEGIGKMVGGVSQITAGLQQLGIEIPAGLQQVVGGMQAVIGILSGIATIVSAIQTMAAVNMFKLANGGIVPAFAGGGIIPRAASGFVMGTSYSGDNIGNVRLNAGELVLNKAQQSTLASQLEGGSMSDLNLSTVIDGEQIRVVLNRNGRRTGRGEFVQSKRG